MELKDILEAILFSSQKPLSTKELQDILKLHVVAGKIKSKDIAEGTTEVETLGGDTIEVVNDGGKITVGGAEVIMADVYTSNGVIHAIDSVILPD